MNWSTEEWDAFCSLLEEAWPGDFPDPTQRAWRTLLDATPPQSAVAGLRLLLHEGRKWRPSVSELLEAVSRDPSRPTFDEAVRLIYGRHGALYARVPATYADEAEMWRLYRAAVRERCEDMHPLIGSFIERQGIERLQGLPLRDPEWGEVERRRLSAAWDRHVDAMDGRDHAVLASGGRRGEFGRLDPLAALDPAGRAELESGGAA